MNEHKQTAKMPVPENWQSQPMRTGQLRATNTHEVWWAEFGHQENAPILVLHGGPGSGSNLQRLAFFDPSKHRIIFFDQRGTGRSTPLAEVSNNDTQGLVADIEALRLHLRIAAWTVFAGSWGAVLGLVYGQLCAQSCVRLILKSIPDRHHNQTRWLMQERPALLPDRHQAFMSYVRANETSDLINELYQASLSDQHEERCRATAAVIVLELGLTDPNPEPLVLPDPGELSAQDIARARVYLHYWAHQSFLPDGKLIFDAEALKQVPITLIHGTSDWICPAKGSEVIHKAVPHSKLIHVEGVGHSPFVPAMQEALRAAIASY